LAQNLQLLPQIDVDGKSVTKNVWDVEAVRAQPPVAKRTKDTAGLPGDDKPIKKLRLDSNTNATLDIQT
jgi:hypothetical protein